MNEFQISDLLNILYAVIAGGLIGFEREYRDKSAGLRTLMFICLGTTVFTILSAKYTGGDPSRVAAGLVTGIGFIGTGVIMRNRGHITGITTAALIWVTAGIGMSIGLGMYYISIFTLLITMILLWILPLLEFKFSHQREAVEYSILIKNNDTTLNEIKKEILKSKITILDESYEKDKETLIVNLNILGNKNSHKLINKYFVDNHNIEKCSIL